MECSRLNAEADLINKMTYNSFFHRIIYTANKKVNQNNHYGGHLAPSRKCQPCTSLDLTSLHLEIILQVYIYWTN